MSVNEHEISVSIVEKVPVLYANSTLNIKLGYCRGIEIINEGGLGNLTGSSFKLPKNEIINLIDNLIKTSYNNDLLSTKDIKKIIKKNE